MSPKILKSLYFLLLLVAFVAPVGFLYALEAPTPLAPLPTPEGLPSTTNGLEKYVQTIFWMAIVAAGVLAVLMIAYGGVLYMVSEAPGMKSDARSKITGAIVGLILAASSVLILQTVNPDLLKFKLALTVPHFDVPAEGDVPSGIKPGCAPIANSSIIAKCAWVTLDGAPSNGDFCNAGDPRERNEVAISDEICSVPKSGYLGPNTCCGTVSPLRGCVGAAVWERYKECRWSLKATLGDDCGELGGGFVWSGPSDSDDWRCQGSRPSDGSDCCLSRP